MESANILTPPSTGFLSEPNIPKGSEYEKIHCINALGEVISTPHKNNDSQFGIVINLSFHGKEIVLQACTKKIHKRSYFHIL